MIREQAIVEWRREAPWSANFMVEQDLVISRALVEIYSVPDLAERLAFRGGTALYKLHLSPAARYSEDIDLVQVRPEPIGDTLDLLRSVLDPWLGTPRRKFNEGRVNLVYRFDSEDSPPVKALQEHPKGRTCRSQGGNPKCTTSFSSSGSSRSWPWP